MNYLWNFKFFIILYVKWRNDEIMLEIFLYVKIFILLRSCENFSNCVMYLNEDLQDIKFLFKFDYIEQMFFVV